MKYRKIMESPEELLSEAEKDKIRNICDYIYNLNSDKIAEQSLQDLYDTAVYLGLTKRFYTKKYAETYISKEESKSNAYMQEIKKITFLYRMMSPAYGNIEREILKNSKVGLIDRAKYFEQFIAYTNSYEAIEERTKKELADIESLEEMRAESKE